MITLSFHTPGGLALEPTRMSFMTGLPLIATSRESIRIFGMGEHWLVDHGACQLARISDGPLILSGE